MPSRRNDALRREQQYLVTQIAQVVSAAHDTTPTRRFLARPALLLAMGAALVVQALIFSAYIDLKTRFDAQSRRMAALEQRLPSRRTVSIPELPPPYETVRSRFEGWHICATDNCGSQSQIAPLQTRL